MELEKALSVVIEHLDSKMEQHPSRELADVTNYLQNIKEGL